MKHAYRKPTLRRVPEREKWLFQNPEALSSVMRGLREMREGKRAEPPDLEADLASIYSPVEELLTGEEKAELRATVDRIIDEYGPVLERLGKE